MMDSLTTGNLDPMNAVLMLPKGSGQRRNDEGIGRRGVAGEVTGKNSSEQSALLSTLSTDRAIAARSTTPGRILAAIRYQVDRLAERVNLLNLLFAAVGPDLNQLDQHFNRLDHFVQTSPFQT